VDAMEEEANETLSRCHCGQIAIRLSRSRLPRAVQMLKE